MILNSIRYHVSLHAFEQLATFMNSHLIPYHICQTATSLFLQHGFEHVTMNEIAKEAQVDEDILFTHFGNKQDIILYLYQRLNAEWQLDIEKMHEQKLSDRFKKALDYKIELVKPYADLLVTLMGELMSHHKIGIQSSRTSHIRSMGLKSMQVIIDGSSDSKSIKNKVPQLHSMLYMMHWAALFVFLQSKNESKTNATIELMASMLQKANKLSFFLQFFPMISEMAQWSNTMLKEPEDEEHKIEKAIVRVLLNHRKIINSDPSCMANTCELCNHLHLDKIRYFTKQHKPIHFILPAFPAKSPNKGKVLGVEPDLGETIALKTLEDICNEIQLIYSPGANITICSDGRIFAELVGITDQEITMYVKGIHQLISELNLQHIQIVNLEDLMKGDSFDALRNTVLHQYSESLDDLYAKLKSDSEFKNLFNGIHRFIVDDRKDMQTSKSISKIKEESKPIALKVIQHSNAWTRFLTSVFPEAIRLSIHPYTAHSEKLGIQLTKANDNWLTPWHGVIVLKNNDYVLMKKQEAEALGAKLIMKNHKNSHFTLTSNE